MAKYFRSERQKKLEMMWQKNWWWVATFFGNDMKKTFGWDRKEPGKMEKMFRDGVA